MGDWQRELRALLAALEVSLEPDGSASFPSFPTALHEGVRPSDSAAETNQAASDAATSPDAEDIAPYGIEVSAIRSEMEATLAEVTRLVQAGRLERSLGDDVVHVLRALTRPGPAARVSRFARRGSRESAQEWELSSAAAVLHFCRIVLRLTREVEADGDL